VPQNVPSTLNTAALPTSFEDPGGTSLMLNSFSLRAADAVVQPQSLLEAVDSSPRSAAEPVFEMRLTKTGVPVGNERALIYVRAEITRLRVSDNLPRIVECVEC
jgi:hypothetical protein